MTYGAVTPAVLAELRGILGDKSVWTDEARLEAYAHDETSVEEYAHPPEVVVLPTTTDHVAAIVKLANHHHIPITPRGAGSGLSGGAIPHLGGILITLERMNQLIELDLANMTITVEAGMVTNDLAHTVAEHGLFFAGYPMSVETCHIGGNIAENAGGGKAIKYGVTGRYVMGLELVTPTGDVVSLGGKLAKDVSGYDLKQLVIGSEGTLGIVTQATIKLVAQPKATADLLVLFATPREAIDLVPAILTAGVVPTSIEFMDRLSFQTSCEYLNETLPYQDAGAMLLIEVDGHDPDVVERDTYAIGDLCEKHGAIEVYVAEDPTRWSGCGPCAATSPRPSRSPARCRAWRTSSCRWPASPTSSPNSSGSPPATACRSPATVTPATATCTRHWSRTRRWTTTPG